MTVLDASKHFFFVNKKEAKKTLIFFDSTEAVVKQARSGAEVFCFFFSKKKCFLHLYLHQTRHIMPQHRHMPHRIGNTPMQPARRPVVEEFNL